MNPINRYSLYLRLTFIIYCIALSSLSLTIAQSDNSNDIEITADMIEVLNNSNKIKATGNILIQTQDYLSSTDNLIYDEDKEILKTSGNVIIKDKLDNYYYFDKFISDKDFSKASGTNTKIRLNDGSRIVGKSFIRTDSNINQINNAIYTPCLQKNYVTENCPGWKLSANKVVHDAEKQNIYYEGATLSILNIPVLYSPFFRIQIPLLEKGLDY